MVSHWTLLGTPCVVCSHSVEVEVGAVVCDPRVEEAKPLVGVMNLALEAIAARPSTDVKDRISAETWERFRDALG